MIRIGILSFCKFLLDVTMPFFFFFFFEVLYVLLILEIFWSFFSILSISVHASWILVQKIGSFYHTLECEILEGTVVINQLVLTSSRNLALNSRCFSLVSVDCSFPWGAEIVSGETMSFQATKRVPGQ